MGLFLLPYFILYFFQLFFYFSSYSSSLVPLCNHEEASGLLQFNNSFTLNSSASDWCSDFDQSSYPKTASWEIGTNCCMWDGVTCDTKSGYVIGLDLSCSWLRGQFHPNNTLFQLIHLQKLNLSFNDFSLSPMVPGFGDLVSLKHLDISHSRFSGVIPSKISHLSKLVSLSIASWTLRLDPSTWKKLILNATDLRDLSLSFVNMSSIRPSSLSLLMNLSSSLVSLDLVYTQLHGNLANNILCLPNLQELDLSWNENLKGKLPKSNWSTQLRYLDLSYTAFFGDVPDSIGQLKSLNHLDLSWCKFDGFIPLSLLNLTQLTSLSLAFNYFIWIPSLSFSKLQHLTSLDLSHCNFNGMIPLSLWNLTQLTYLWISGSNISSEIPSLLSNLQHLTALDLSFNNISGHIPDFFGNLSKLECLLLDDNNLGGQLPATLIDLTQLRFFSCSYNKLAGPIPNKIGRLSNLTHLDLSSNLLNGTIPQGVFSMPSLSYLNLAKNQLTGSIGEFSTYSLKLCYLSGNKLQGNIPKSMFDIVNITFLSLASNNLSGFVHFHQFSKLQYLTYLDLSHNSFLSLSFDSNVEYTIPFLELLLLSSCNINTFPKFLARLRNLHHIDLSNNRIHGRIPKWMNEHLSLSWRNIQYIDLSFNMLEGDVPIPIFGIEFFSVSNNKFTGDISSVICNASSLIILNLSHNNLIGKIPQCLGMFPFLLVLDLKTNNLSGALPKNFSRGNALQTLNLNGNQLRGSLPPSLVHCKQLEVLDLGENKIEDTFPNWIEPLQELKVLILRANKFHGVITHLMTKDSFPKLRIFDVSNNYFRGSLPKAYIKNFKEMMNINDGPTGLQYMKSKYYAYNDSVVVIMKGNYFELERILTTFTTIDLSNNMFDGEIPHVIHELKSLVGLNLSHNRITGRIPQSLGDLKCLEWLDLSSNKLVGNIPLTLTNLNYLSFLNLSQNMLEGIIPIGRQFNTFQNDSYEGNPGLCGLPLSKSCTKDEDQPPDLTTFHHEEHFGFGWKAVALGYACGVVFGMLLGYVVLSNGKPQWLVRLFQDVPNKRVKKKINRTHANRRGMN